MNPLLHWLTSPKWTHVVGALLHSLWQGAIHRSHPRAGVASPDKPGRALSLCA